MVLRAVIGIRTCLLSNRCSKKPGCSTILTSKHSLHLRKLGFALVFLTNTDRISKIRMKCSHSIYCLQLLSSPLPTHALGFWLKHEIKDTDMVHYRQVSKVDT